MVNTLSTLEENVALEGQRIAAYKSRNMPAYATACDCLGIDVEPELSDDVSFGLDIEQEKYLMNNLEKVQKRIDVRKRRAKMKNPEYYDNLLKIAVDSGMINKYKGIAKLADEGRSLEPHRDTINLMRVQLKAATGYNKLNGNDKEKVSIWDAKLGRIVKMYRDYIKTAKEIQADQ